MELPTAVSSTLAVTYIAEMFSTLREMNNTFLYLIIEMIVKVMEVNLTKSICIFFHFSL